MEGEAIRIVHGPEGQLVGIVQFPDGQLWVMEIADPEGPDNRDKTRLDEIEQKLDNLAEYVRVLMTVEQRLRRTPPEK